MIKTKRILAFWLAGVTVLSLLTFPAAAAGGATEQTAQQTVSALGIMVGDADGNMRLDSCVTRAQLSKILVTLAFGNITLSSSVSPFPDVTYKHWAAPYVSRAVTAGYINGYPDGMFKPEQYTKTEEVVKTLLSVLGYTSADYGVGYPYAQMSFATKLGLFSGVTAQVGTFATRRDVMMLVYNTLTATAKNGRPYATSLGYSLTSAGTVDISGLIQNNSAGPITVTSPLWYQGTGLTLSNISVYLNDQPSSLDAVALDSIVYYSVNMNTVWAYNKRVTGTLENVKDSRLSPTSVVVAGTEYKLGSAAASEAVSFSGSFKYGDVVTLLFGRGGTVADIVKADSSVKVVGIATGAGSKIYTSDGNTYSSFFVRLMTFDGSIIEYKVPEDSSAHVGKAVIVTFNGTAVHVSRLAPNEYDVGGKVSAAAMKIGDDIMAGSIRILDTDEYGNVVTIYPQRLDGVTLESSKILYSSKDDSGAVTQLILQNVTGDTASYGVVTSATKLTSQGFFGGSVVSETNGGTYTYNIGGTTGTVRSSTYFPVEKGPACFAMKNGSVALISSLQPLTGVTLSGFNAVVTFKGEKHQLWDKGSVFQLMSDGTYKLTTLTAVSGMSLTAYYDKNEDEGGLIRVIIAQ